MYCPWISRVHKLSIIFPFSQTVWLTLGVLTVVVKGRGIEIVVPRRRTEFIAIFVVECLHVRFVSQF